MAEQDADKSGLAEGRMTLIGHLTELRNRLGVALGVFLLLFLISVAPLPGTTSNSIAYQVFVFLQAPLAEILNAKGGGRMIFTALHEGFFTQIKVGFFYRALHHLSDHQHAALEIRRPRTLQK